MGLSYYEQVICELESSRNGWNPMFYFTGSCRGDWRAAKRMRRAIGKERPSDVTAELAQDLIEHRRAVLAYRKQRAAKLEAHIERMRVSWWYRLKCRFKTPQVI